MTGRILLSLPLIGLAVGCAGARAKVTAEEARYPISMSPHVRDESGKVHGRATLEEVGHFHSSGKRAAILYSSVTFRPKYDISKELNQQIEAAGGEAVVSLHVKVTDRCWFLNGFPILSVLPIWPGCVPIAVDGEIVKRKEAPVIQDPAAAANPPPKTAESPKQSAPPPASPAPAAPSAAEPPPVSPTPAAPPEAESPAPVPAAEP